MTSENLAFVHFNGSSCCVLFSALDGGAGNKDPSINSLVFSGRHQDFVLLADKG